MEMAGESLGAIAVTWQLWATLSTFQVCFVLFFHHLSIELVRRSTLFETWSNVSLDTWFKNARFYEFVIAFPYFCHPPPSILSILSAR